MKVDTNTPSNIKGPKTPDAPSTCKEKFIHFAEKNKTLIRIAAIALIVIGLIALCFGINPLPLAISIASIVLGVTSLGISALVKRSLPKPPTPPPSPPPTPTNPSAPPAPTPTPIPPVDVPAAPTTPVVTAPPSTNPVAAPIVPPPVTVVTAPTAPAPIVPLAPATPLRNYTIALQLGRIGNVPLDVTNRSTLDELYARLGAMSTRNGCPIPSDCRFELSVNGLPIDRSVSLATILENTSNRYSLTPVIAGTNQVRIHPNHAAIFQALRTALAVPVPVVPVEAAPAVTIAPAPKNLKVTLKLIPRGKIDIEVPNNFTVDELYQFLQRKMKEGGYTPESPLYECEFKLLINGKKCQNIDSLEKILRRVGNSYSLGVSSTGGGQHPNRNEILTALQSALPSETVTLPPAPKPVMPRATITIIPPVPTIVPVAPQVALPKGSFQIQCEDESLILSWATTTTVKNLITYLKDSAQLGGYRSDFAVELRINNGAMRPNAILKAKTGNLIDNCVLKISHPSYKEILNAIRKGMGMIKKTILAADHWSSHVKIGEDSINPHRNIKLYILINNRPQLYQFSYINTEATLGHIKAIMLDHQSQFPLFLEDGRKILGTFSCGGMALTDATYFRDLPQKQIVYAKPHVADVAPRLTPEDLMAEQRRNPNFMRVTEAVQVPVDPEFDKLTPNESYNEDVPTEAEKKYLAEREKKVLERQKVYLQEIAIDLAMHPDPRLSDPDLTAKLLDLAETGTPQAIVQNIELFQRLLDGSIRLRPLDAAAAAGPAAPPAPAPAR